MSKEALYNEKARGLEQIRVFYDVVFKDKEWREEVKVVYKQIKKKFMTFSEDVNPYQSLVKAYQ